MRKENEEVELFMKRIQFKVKQIQAVKKSDRAEEEKNEIINSLCDMMHLDVEKLKYMSADNVD